MTNRLDRGAPLNVMEKVTGRKSLGRHGHEMQDDESGVLAVLAWDVYIRCMGEMPRLLPPVLAK